MPRAFDALPSKIVARTVPRVRASQLRAAGNHRAYSQEYSENDGPP